MSNSNYQKLLDDYGQRLNVGRSETGTSDSEVVVVNGRTVALSFRPDHLHPDDGMVICRTDVARFNGGAMGDAFRLLLQANNLWAGSQGSTLGLRGTNMLMMSAARRIGSLNANTLDAMVKMLCADAESWASRLTSKSRTVPAQPDLHRIMDMRA